MSTFPSGTHAASRIHALEKERRKLQGDVERRRGKISAASTAVINSAVAASGFTAPSDTVDDMLTTDTVGLVTHSDFKARRQYLERCSSLEREKREALLEDAASRASLSKRKCINKSVLSFQTDDSENDDVDSDDEEENREKQKTNPVRKTVVKRRRLGKDPSVDTKFLPDRERESAERAERERLKEDWLRQQENIKNEVIRITYSYWDGSGHRRSCLVKKGTTVGRFLATVQSQFKQLRNMSADELMFVKEDLIIPHHYSFYDFVVMKARGKSGPLFNFDVVEDVRVVDDATKEKEDAHAGKVCDRRWYERNRHIFPASRWEVYDPNKKYDRYTTHGN